MNLTMDRNTALVVIDVQNDYFPGGRFVLFRAKAALRTTLHLRDWARGLGIPIFWVRHTGAADGRFFRPGTPGADFHPDLGILPEEEIVDKTNPNSFVGTDLEDRLRARNIHTLVVAGMMTWMCIDTTVRSAKDRGFTNVLAYDACASGWLIGPYGPVTPWSAQRAFVSALSFHHASVLSTRQIVGLPFR